MPPSFTRPLRWLKTRTKPRRRQSHTYHLSTQIVCPAETLERIGISPGAYVLHMLPGPHFLVAGGIARGIPMGPAPVGPVEVRTAV